MLHALLLLCSQVSAARGVWHVVLCDAKAPGLRAPGRAATDGKTNAAPEYAPRRFRTSMPLSCCTSARLLHSMSSLMEVLTWMTAERRWRMSDDSRSTLAAHMPASLCMSSSMEDRPAGETRLRTDVRMCVGAGWCTAYGGGPLWHNATPEATQGYAVARQPETPSSLLCPPTGRDVCVPALADHSCAVQMDNLRELCSNYLREWGSGPAVACKASSSAVDFTRHPKTMHESQL